MKNRIKSILKTLGIFFGIGLIFCGLNAFVMHISAVIVANNRFQMIDVFVALLFIIPGYILMRLIIKTIPRYYYTISGCLFVIGVIYISNYFSFMEYVHKEMSGLNLRVYEFMLKTNLGIGILTLLLSIGIIGYQITKDRKEKAGIVQ